MRPPGSDLTRSRGRSARRLRPRPEPLEDRRLLATFTVVNNLDAGDGSLRWALEQAEASPDADDRVDFAIAGSTEILLGSPLPPIQNPVVIDATAQPGVALVGSLTPGFGSGLVIEGSGVAVRGLQLRFFEQAGILVVGSAGPVVLEGNRGLANGVSGIAVIGSAGVTIQGNWVESNTGPGLLIQQSEGVVARSNGTGNNGQSGIYVLNSSEVAVEGNFVGFGEDGFSFGNQVAGILVEQSRSIRVGSAGPGGGNWIGASAGPALLIANSVEVAALGNSVGFGPDGGPAGNRQGIQVAANSSRIWIGSADPGGGNRIGHNGGPGLEILSSGDVAVLGNAIGMDFNGNPAGNLGSGIAVGSSSGRILIGAAEPGAGNQVGFSTGSGLEIQNSSDVVVQGNSIGVAADGRVATNGQHGVRIGSSLRVTIGGTGPSAGNTIASNGGAGISADGVDLLVVQGNRVGLGPSGRSSPYINTANGAEGIELIRVIDAVVGGPEPVARNLIAENIGPGISVDFSGRVAVLGNWIGLDGDGLPAGNRGDGIEVIASPDVRIGGSRPGEGNAIGSNGQAGISVRDAWGLRIEGNAIGLDPTGTLPRGNGSEGIQVSTRGTAFNVPGPEPAVAIERNVIAANQEDGISVVLTPDVRIRGNTIGLGDGSDGSLSNGENGIRIFQFGLLDPESQDPVEILDNAILNNFGSGVTLSTVHGTILRGNRIGAEADEPDRGNGISGIAVDFSYRVQVGGPNPGDGNVIVSSFGAAVAVQTSFDTAILGNYLGVTPAGAMLPNQGDGVRVRSSTTTWVGGPSAAGNVIAANYGNGVLVDNSEETILQGNTIGLMPGGLAVDRGGNLGDGVRSQFSTRTIIGGTRPGEGNLISGNFGRGILFQNDLDAFALGNRIGLDARGVAWFQSANGADGIFVLDAFQTTLGAAGPHAGNVIAANLGYGIQLAGSTDATWIQGNRIGTPADGSVPPARADDDPEQPAYGNSRGGILDGGGGFTTIGGPLPGQGNVISGNFGPGVTIATPNRPAQPVVVLGNRIGTDLAGTSANGNFGDGVLVRQPDLGFEVVTVPGISVGGYGPADGNVIGDNRGDGVRITGIVTAVQILGNAIGLGADGVTPLGNHESGIHYAGQSAIAILLGAPGAGNRIGNNGASGIRIEVDGTAGAGRIRVQGNRIGTDATGTVAIGNFGDGLTIGPREDADSDAGSAPDSAPTPGAVLVGGAGPLDGNVLADNGTAGIRVEGVPGVAILGNFIGIGLDGVTPLGNSAAGVLLEDGTTGTVVGAPGAGNLIGHNSVAGVQIVGASATGNRVQANRIGTDGSGTLAIGNDYGVLIQGAPGNLIGGTGPGEGNLISGNDPGGYPGAAPPGQVGADGLVGPPAIGTGVYITGRDASGNLITGNRIGTDAAGLLPLPNGSGVYIEGASRNQVRGNLISGNRAVGVYIFGGNPNAQESARGNVLAGNTIGLPLGKPGRRARGRSPLANGLYGVLFYNAPDNGRNPAQTNRIGPGGLGTFREFTGAFSRPSTGSEGSAATLAGAPSPPDPAAARRNSARRARR